PDANPFYQRVYVALAVALNSLFLWSSRADWGLAMSVFTLIHLFIFWYGYRKAANPLVFAGHWATVGLLQTVVWVIFSQTQAGVALAAGLAVWCWVKRWGLATQRH
ncbi:MAG TPA: hypothetical protein PKL15_21780, partial [Saprospiraceae bacterium]|nr:hypothetical protein [Saprospiraceae bacterium]